MTDGMHPTSGLDRGQTDDFDEVDEEAEAAESDAAEEARLLALGAGIDPKSLLGRWAAIDIGEVRDNDGKYYSRMEYGLDDQGNAVRLDDDDQAVQRAEYAGLAPCFTCEGAGFHYSDPEQPDCDTCKGAGCVELARCSEPDRRRALEVARVRVAAHERTWPDPA
jgi:hypothetical protein